MAIIIIAVTFTIAWFIAWNLGLRYGRLRMMKSLKDIGSPIKVMPVGEQDYIVMTSKEKLTHEVTDRLREMLINTFRGTVPDEKILVLDNELKLDVFRSIKPTKQDVEFTKVKKWAECEVMDHPMLTEGQCPCGAHKQQGMDIAAHNRRDELVEVQVGKEIL